MKKILFLWQNDCHVNDINHLLMFSSLSFIVFLITVLVVQCFFVSVNAFTQSNSNIEQSTWKPGRIDQPEYSSAWLKAFRTVNQSAIENVCLFVNLFVLQLILAADIQLSLYAHVCTYFLHDILWLIIYNYRYQPQKNISLVDKMAFLRGHLLLEWLNRYFMLKTFSY